MRFIIDANLPAIFAQIFINLGHDAVHTSEFTDGNATQDQDILIIADPDGIIISKDSDFYDSFLLTGKPNKLVLVKVGNMKYRPLLKLITQAAPSIVDLLGQHDCLELHKDKIIKIV